MMSVMKSRQTDERTHWPAASPLQPNKSKTSEQVPSNLSSMGEVCWERGCGVRSMVGARRGFGCCWKRSVCSIHSSHNMAHIKKPQQRHIKVVVDAVDDKVVFHSLWRYRRTERTKNADLHTVSSLFATKSVYLINSHIHTVSSLSGVLVCCCGARFAGMIWVRSPPERVGNVNVHLFVPSTLGKSCYLQQLIRKCTCKRF